MQSMLKRMNRGVLLFLILLVGVIFYLAALTISQNRERPALEAMSRDYLAQEVTYRQLPEAYRDPSIVMPEEAFSDYLRDMEEAIAPFYEEGSRAQELATERLKTHLEGQNMTHQPILHFEKTIVQFQSFVFDGSRATVTVLSQSVVERPEDILERGMGGRIADEVEDEIMLEKIDGEWKVIYASINEPWRRY